MSTKQGRRTPVGGYRKARKRFEEATQAHFRGAVESAWDASWNEAKKNGLGKMGVFTAVKIINTALMREVARYLPGL